MYTSVVRMLSVEKFKIILINRLYLPSSYELEILNFTTNLFSLTNSKKSFYQTRTL